MKFTVSSKLLYNTASAVSKVIGSKNPLTILNNFLFEVDETILKISASDNENVLTATLEISDCEDSGRFCVDARRLVDLLKELPDSGLEFRVDTETYAIQVECANGEFDFVGLNGDEYPSFAQVSGDASDDTKQFTTAASVLLDGIDNTLFAVGTDELRPQMMGILWDIEPDKITFAATDTRKLVRYIDRNIEPGVTGHFIFPVKPINIFKNIFSADEEVNVLLTSNAARFSNERFALQCQYIKGNFPNYNAVIPKNNPYVLTIDRRQFVNAVRRVAVFVEPGHGLVKCRLSADCITMKVQDNNYCAKAIEQIKCEYEGQEMVIGFSAPYLIDVASTLPGEQMVIQLADPSRPGVFLPAEQPENTDLVMLLMPMTVQEF